MMLRKVKPEILPCIPYRETSDLDRKRKLRLTALLRVSEATTLDD